jgi:hypothetical protein
LKNARTLAARCTLTGIALAGASVAFVAATPQTVSGAPAQLTLTETWNAGTGTILNDAPCGVAEASPVEFDDGGAAGVEVGDRQGDLYGLNLQTGAVLPGWGSGSGGTVGSGQGCSINPSGGTPDSSGVNGTELPGSPPVDSTASVNGNNELYFGAGNAASPVDGGYYAYNANGTEAWNQVVANPATDDAPDGGVQASLPIADEGSLVEGGSLGQMTYGLNAANGSPATGWPQFSADSVFSTAATGDFYGTGSDDFAVGGASSAGFALGTHYSAGGHVRIYNDHGGLICSANTTEEVDSSPAVGPILAGGAYGIATGTGTFYPGASDENTVKVYDTKCNQVWSDALDGSTGGSPALADVQGNGQLAVVEGTGNGSVYALNAQTGSVIWRTSVGGAVVGSVTTADLNGSGAQDVIVPTTNGFSILDGPTGLTVAQIDNGTHSTTGGIVPAGGTYGFQNAPLVTADPNGSIGITVAGYFGIGGNEVQGIVQHFEVENSSSSLADALGGWPQFHHDAQLTGFVGGGNALGTCQRPVAAQSGYLTVASDGGIFSFGQDFCGSTGSMTLNKPVVGMAAVPGQSGYWLVASDGGIFSYGGAGFYGSTGSLTLNAPVVGMAATPNGAGYWLVASDGGIFSYGDAGFYGSAASTPGQDIVGMAETPDGLGYWEVSTTGRVFSFGDATAQGDIPSLGIHLNGAIVGITPDPVTGGYWLVGSDGGIFSFGAPFFGSTGGIHLNQPVVAMQSTGDGGGYWFVASDGGIFSYGDAPFRGSMGGQHLNKPMVGMDGF